MDIKLLVMDLLQGFKDFIKAENLFAAGDRLLLAVSGGVDSVVLCELCHQSGQDFVLAHVNFGLRGQESVRDEEFVRGLAKKYEKPLLVKAFDTMKHAAENKLSVQVAARQLRYDWFRSILGDSSPDTGEVGIRHILTAHHMDDNIETLLMNFFKGTGIAGLRGILPRQGDIVRPLLFAWKEQLRDFATANHLEWMEDSSNAADKYTRNYFRHHLIPLVQQVFPEAMVNLGENTRRFREIETVYGQSIDLHKRRLMVYRGQEIFIPALLLQKTAPLHTIVYEIIKDFGFTAHQVPAIVALLDSGSGKYVRSATHRILRNRAWLIISPLEVSETGLPAHILIESPALPVDYEQGALHFASQRPDDRTFDPPSLQTPPHIAMLDGDAIRFPLLLRKWKPGDYFYPLGMRKKKKLARFFIDSKLSLAEKERIWVLEMDKKIIWVIGMRIDDRFRLTPQTSNILSIRNVDSSTRSGKY